MSGISTCLIFLMAVIKACSLHVWASDITMIFCLDAKTPPLADPIFGLVANSDWIDGRPHRLWRVEDGLCIGNAITYRQYQLRGTGKTGKEFGLSDEFES